jgi:predicted transcriptional regulator
MMQTVPIHFTLRERLDELAITPYQLSKTSGVSLNTVYSIVHDRTKRIDKDTLDALLTGLGDLTGKTFEVSDVLGYERD